jgi:Putative prokaryotic signal transducing protein
MGNIDPQQERARLAARYAAMSDLELEKVGRSPSALTEWARDALAAEMHRRGLEWRPPLKIAKPVDEHAILIRLGDYGDRNTAGLVRDFLEGKGIPSFFREEEIQGEEQTGAPSTELLVRASDLAMARSLLAEREQAELAFRNSKDNSSTLDRPVILRRYRDMPQAVVEKSVLDDAGIPCYLQDDNVIRMDWLWSNAMGGIKLLVREQDASDAERLLISQQADTSQNEQEKP